MALTQGARNKIKSFVQNGKHLLMKEFAAQLQQYYGIRPDGSYLLVEELTTKDASIIQTARLLRERLEYLEDTIAGSNKKEEAVEQLVREQAFTILNRFAALRMAEERNIIPETVNSGYNSEGFQVYDQLTGGAQTGEQFERYTWFLRGVFDELAIDLPAVFDRYSPYALLFPSEKVMLELLDIINDEDLNIYREEGHQPINLWEADETIGWVYQYYNSREEISAMREASGAPRNSRELAVRNQFFTPRYVVQFLVDNSLGRQWYEMTKGETRLVDSCEYMVKREQEIFLVRGETIPETTIDGANYIEYRALKDPREILMLDPACGSMHFGLYCFDLFEKIYVEAWDNYPELMPDLRDKYLRADFIKRIPGYILQYNIHGVDIDPRAIQIAGLSLWLRAQKSYKDLELSSSDRPMIKKSNLVVAEPMPGDADLLSEFTRSLPGPIGKLVRVIWDKMKLAGETGLLLKIEEELKNEIEIARQEYEAYKDSSAQTTLFDAPEDSKVAEMAAIYGQDQNITEDFFDTAEEEVLNALKSFAENGEGEHAFQKLLFAEDTARGFAFIELCRKRYDVIVMNPPFGAGSVSTENYYKLTYPNWGKNILCCFFYRMHGLLSRNGMVGAIFDRTVVVKSSYEEFRKESFVGKINSVMDTGWGVLDANVETTVFITGNNIEGNESVFLNLRDFDNKENQLKYFLNRKDLIVMPNDVFSKLPNTIIGYDFDSFQLQMFKKFKSLSQQGYPARQGHVFNSFAHYRNFWEVNKYENFKHLYNGSLHSIGYIPYRELVFYKDNGEFIRFDKKLRSSNGQRQLKKGLGYGKRGNVWDTHILRSSFVFTVEGQAIPELTEFEALKICSYTNSSSIQYLINSYCAQHKHAGYVSLLPYPNLNSDISFISEIITLKRKWISYDETSLEFRTSFLSILLNEFESIMDLDNMIQDFITSYKKDYSKLMRYISSNDEYWKNQLNLSNNEKGKVKKFEEKRPGEPLLFIDGIKEDNLNVKIIVEEMIQNLVGIVFNRWDQQILIYTANNFFEDNIFEELDFKPVVSQIDSKVEYLENRLLVKKLKNKIDSISLGRINIDDLIGFYLKVDYSSYFQKPTHFFDYHLNRYTKSRRDSPIYWPIGTASSKFVIWLYYPNLDENTLFKVLNESLEPKLKQVEKNVEVLELNGSSKQYNEELEFLGELQDFKDELLRVAQLPYNPNQDDGVLITAAPLYNLFRHAKWRKSTEACWKKLEKGEYDWAHLAYSIWPDRVANKCKKDLSLAIAHGLESICEIKPKVTKPKKKPEIKIEKQNKLI